ncbi:MAG: metallopeptidase TldD-related protein [Deltaproteobacteria bacterium]|nr:metallopeptidase TldD-related protein [Deltaproteobacteria bacterium]
MTPEEVFKIVKERSAGCLATTFELYLVSSNQTVIEGKGGEISCYQKAEPKGAAIRIFGNKKVGFSTTSSWERSALERMVDFASSGMAFLEEDAWVGPVPLPSTLPPFEGLDRSLLTIPEKKKFELVIGLERKAKEHDSRVTRVRKAEYQEEVTRVHLFSSESSNGNHELSYEKSLCEIAIQVMVEEKKDQQASWDSDFATHFAALHPDKVALGAADKALSLLGAGTIPTQKVPALLDPGVSTSFLGMLISSFLAENVQKGKTVLADKKGKKIFSEAISLVDDGLMKGGYRSSPFDGEGMPRQTTTVVEKGVLKNFLYDTYRARRDKTTSTGNSLRSSYREPPTLAHSNFFVTPGRRTVEAMLQDVDKGFWVTDVIGVHTIDPFSGDFSVGATGFWIEKGKKKQAVRGVAIAGNLQELFNQVVEVASDLRFYESVGSPSLLVSSLQISGT